MVNCPCNRLRALWVATAVLLSRVDAVASLFMYKQAVIAALNQIYHSFPQVCLSSANEPPPCCFSVVSLLPFTVYIPSLRGLAYLRRNIRDLTVYGLEYACILSCDRLDHALFDPVCYPVKQTAHKGLPEQSCKKRDQRGTHQRNTAACHKLFHALALC